MYYIFFSSIFISFIKENQHFHILCILSLPHIVVHNRKLSQEICFILPLCVCVCVCVCVFILFYLLVSSGCTTSVTYVSSWDQRSFVESISRASAKFLHLFFWIYSISPPKMKTPIYNLFTMQDYVQGAPRKKQLIVSFVKHLKGKSWKHYEGHFSVSVSKLN